MWVLSERLFQLCNRPEGEMSLGFRRCPERGNERVLKRNVFYLLLFGSFSLKSNKENRVSHVQHATKSHCLLCSRWNSRGVWERAGVWGHEAFSSLCDSDKAWQESSLWRIENPPSGFSLSVLSCKCLKLIPISHTFHAILASYQMVQSSIILTHGEWLCHGDVSVQQKVQGIYCS